METSFPSSAPAPTQGPSKIKIVLGVLAIAIIVMVVGTQWLPNMLSGLKSCLICGQTAIFQETSRIPLESQGLVFSNPEISATTDQKTVITARLDANAVADLQGTPSLHFVLLQLPEPAPDGTLIRIDIVDGAVLNPPAELVSSTITPSADQKSLEVNLLLNLLLPPTGSRVTVSGTATKPPRDDGSQNIIDTELSGTITFTVSPATSDGPPTTTATDPTIPAEETPGESPTSFSIYSGSNIAAGNQSFENVTDGTLQFDPEYPWSIFGNFDPTKELKGKIRVTPDAEYPQYFSIYAWGPHGSSAQTVAIYEPPNTPLVEGSAGTDETAIPPNTPVTIDLPEAMENLGLGGITIKTTENASPVEATVSVVSLATVPPLTREGEQVPPLPAGEQTAQAMDISTNISNANLQKVTLTITMPASEIQGDLADYDVRQLVGTTWRDPTLISARIVGDQAEFMIEVNHFSLFVITKKKTTSPASAQPATPAKPAETGAGTTAQAGTTGGTGTAQTSGATTGAASGGNTGAVSTSGSGGSGTVSSGSAVSGGGGGGSISSGGGGAVSGGGGGVSSGGTVSSGVSGGAVGGGFGAISVPSTFTPPKPAAEVPVALSSVSVQTKANTATKVALTDTVKKQGIAEWKLTTKKSEKVPVELKVFKNLPAVDDHGKTLTALPTNVETKKIIFLKTTSTGVKKSTLTLRLTKDEMKGKSQKDLAVQTLQKGKWKALKIAKLTKGKDGSVTITVDSNGTTPLVVTAKKAEVKKAAAPKKSATKAKKKK